MLHRKETCCEEQEKSKKRRPGGRIGQRFVLVCARDKVAGKGKRRGERKMMRGKERATEKPRETQSRQIQREIRAGHMMERVKDQKWCFHLYFYLIQKCAHIKKKCQLRERTAQTVRKAVLTEQPT